MINASLKLRAQPYKRAEVMSALDALAERMRHAPGCVRCGVQVEADDANALVLASEWHDGDSADAFLDSHEFQILSGFRILLRDEPVIVLDDIRARVTRMIRSQR